MHARPFRIRRRPPTSASWTRSRPSIGPDHQRCRPAPCLAGCRRRRPHPPGGRLSGLTGSLPPVGDPNFARTVPADDVVVRAAADWASELGEAADGDLGRHSISSLMDQFTEAAEERGVQVTDPMTAATGSISTGAGRSLRPGDPDDQTRGRLARADRLRSPRPESATRFILRPRVPRGFGRDPGPYAAYGYEAMELVLQSMSDAGIDASQFRDNVRRVPSAPSATDSVLGDYSIDSDGDTTECMIQRYRGDEPLGASCPPPSAEGGPRSPADPRSPSRPSRASPGSGRSRSSAGRGPRGR